MIILAQATLDEIFLLKLTSYLSPKAIIVSSSGLGHHFWSSVPFGITELTDFIIKSFYSLKYPKKTVFGPRRHLPLSLNIEYKENPFYFSIIKV